MRAWYADSWAILNFVEYTDDPDPIRNTLRGVMFRDWKPVHIGDDIEVYIDTVNPKIGAWIWIFQLDKSP